MENASDRVPHRLAPLTRGTRGERFSPAHQPALLMAASRSRAPRGSAGHRRALHSCHGTALILEATPARSPSHRFPGSAFQRFYHTYIGTLIEDGLLGDNIF